MPALKAIIFDVDGTLAETEELHRRAFNATFEAAGLDWHWNETLYAKLLEVTGGKERIAHFIASHAPAQQPDTAQIAALHRDKTARYTALIDGGDITLRPGVADLITQAQQAKIRLAIATTTSRPNVDALLRATFGGNPFEVIAAGDEVPAKKPAPDIYLLAMQRLALPPESCIAIEDTMNGLRSAQAAGLNCIITTSLYGGQGPFPGAAHILPDLEGAQLASLAA
jgi:HAD superfamily hydrolase (TIGR01509 family)